MRKTDLENFVDARQEFSIESSSGEQLDFTDMCLVYTITHEDAVSSVYHLTLMDNTEKCLAEMEYDDWWTPVLSRADATRTAFLPWLGGGEEVEDCPLCLEPMEPGRAYQTGCGHRFHLECMQKDAMQNRSRQRFFPSSPCPICRRPHPTDGGTSQASRALTFEYECDGQARRIERYYRHLEAYESSLSSQSHAVDRIVQSVLREGSLGPTEVTEASAPALAEAAWNVFSRRARYALSDLTSLDYHVVNLAGIVVPPRPPRKRRREESGGEDHLDDSSEPGNDASPPDMWSLFVHAGRHVLETVHAALDAPKDPDEDGSPLILRDLFEDGELEECWISLTSMNWFWVMPDGRWYVDSSSSDEDFEKCMTMLSRKERFSLAAQLLLRVATASVDGMAEIVRRFGGEGEEEAEINDTSVSFTDGTVIDVQLRLEGAGSSAHSLARAYPEDALVPCAVAAGVPSSKARDFVRQLREEEEGEESAEEESAEEESAEEESAEEESAEEESAEEDEFGAIAKFNEIWGTVERSSRYTFEIFTSDSEVAESLFEYLNDLHGGTFDHTVHRIGAYVRAELMFE
jgi:negative regulator of genetic competence, sporulation and motility